VSDLIRLLIADDHALFRDGLATILSAEADIEVVAQASNAEEAVRLAVSLRPDIALLDIDMPGSGITAAQQVAQQRPETKIVMLTAMENEDNLVQALKAGAQAYILKGVAARELLRILRAVHTGESYVPPGLAAGLLRVMSAPPRETDPFEELTAREREILEALADGLSNKEIATRTFLSEKTVKHYVTNVLQKLQVRSRLEAALLAQKHSRRA
jgi:DNA-binding NarL/FixJ family response regulator